MKKKKYKERKESLSTLSTSFFIAWVSKQGDGSPDSKRQPTSIDLEKYLGYCGNLNLH